MKHQHTPRTPRGWTDPYNPPLPAARRAELHFLADSGYTMPQTHERVPLWQAKKGICARMEAFDATPVHIRKLIHIAGLSCCKPQIEARKYHLAEKILRDRIDRMRQARLRTKLDGILERV